MYSHRVSLLPRKNFWLHLLFSCKNLLLKIFQKIFGVAQGISGERLFMSYIGH
jgi:hypothetical protein